MILIGEDMWDRLSGGIDIIVGEPRVALG